MRSIWTKRSWKNILRRRICNAYLVTCWTSIKTTHVNNQAHQRTKNLSYGGGEYFWLLVYHVVEAGGCNCPWMRMNLGLELRDTSAVSYQDLHAFGANRLDCEEPTPSTLTSISAGILENVKTWTLTVLKYLICKSKFVCSFLQSIRQFMHVLGVWKEDLNNDMR
jgi:hypothetical protein